MTPCRILYYHNIRTRTLHSSVKETAEYLYLLQTEFDSLDYCERIRLFLWYDTFLRGLKFVFTNYSTDNMLLSIFAFVLDSNLVLNIPIVSGTFRICFFGTNYVRIHCQSQICFQ